MPDDVHRAGFERDIATVDEEVLRDGQHFVAAVTDVECSVRQPQHVVGMGRVGAGEVYPLQRRLRDVRSRARDDDRRRPGADVHVDLVGRREAADVDEVLHVAGAAGRPEQRVEAAAGA